MELTFFTSEEGDALYVDGKLVCEDDAIDTIEELMTVAGGRVRHADAEWLLGRKWKWPKREEDVEVEK